MNRNGMEDEDLIRLVEAGFIKCKICGDPVTTDIEGVLGYHEKCFDEFNTYRTVE